VRRVAAEAGWSTGSLRHYFQTHSQLLTFAMELVIQRVTQRVSALRPEGSVQTTARRVLAEPGRRARPRRRRAGARG
jgi:AcrR family transcriptional regulator